MRSNFAEVPIRFQALSVVSAHLLVNLTKRLGDKGIVEVSIVVRTGCVMSDIKPRLPLPTTLVLFVATEQTGCRQSVQR
jgi:hypothetical protein